MRLWIKIPLIVVAAITVVIGALYLYVFQFGGLERVVNSKIDSLLDDSQPLDVEIGSIEGNILSDIVIRDLRVYYSDSLLRYQVVHVPRLATAYSAANIIDKRFILDYLVIDSASISVKQDSTGRWLIPLLAKRTDSTGEAGAPMPTFSVDDLSLNSINVNLQGQTDTLNFENIMASLSVVGVENTYSVNIQQFEFLSNRKELELRAAEGKVTFANKRLVFKDIYLLAMGTRVKLDGFIDLVRPVTGMIDFSADGLDLAEVSQYIGPKLRGVVDVNGTVNFHDDEISGTADIAGQFMFASLQNLFIDFSFADKMLMFDTLYGTVFENCAIDGSGYVDFAQKPELYELTADIRQFNLKNLAKNTFESNLNGRIAVSGESFRNKSLLLDVRTDVFESTFDQYPIHRGSGRLLITSDSIIFKDSFRVEYFENVFLASGKIDYSDEMDLDITIDLANLDRYRGKLFIDQPGGRGLVTAKLSGKTSDPDLTGVFTSDSVWIYGLRSDSMYATVDIERFLTGKQGTVEVDFFRGAAWDTPYDTGYAFMRIDSNLVYFDTAHIGNPYTRLDVAGSYDYEALPGQLTVDTLTLDLFGQVFHNRGVINIEADSAGFNAARATIGSNGAQLSVLGRANYDETLALDLSLNRIQIEPWKNLFAESLLVDGILSCEASLSGSIMQPEFLLRAQIDSVIFRDLWLGDITTSLEYRDRLLTIEDFQLLSRVGDYRAEGHLAIDLAFTADSLERFPDRPMNVHFAAVDSRFDLVTLLQPTIEEVMGDFFADFTLSGTPHDPHLEGEAFIIKPSLKYFDLEHWLYADSAGVKMTDNRIIIDGIETYVMDGDTRRYASFEGTVTVLSLDNFYYDLDVTIGEKFPFRYELDDIAGTADGTLHVEGDTPPRVTGNVKLGSMRYLVNFAEPGEGSPIMTALSGEHSWDLEIDVDILSNYWIKNEDIDAEFSGEVTLIRESGVYSFIGEMEILRGRGFLFDKIFRLEPGSRVVFEGGETFNPTLDIIGSTRILGTSAQAEDAGEIEELTLEIQVGGTLEEPEIGVTENSDIGSQEAIVPLLVANYYSQDGTEASGNFERRVANIVSTQVSRIGSRLLGVETFEIDQAQSEGIDPRGTRVKLGKGLTSNLYTSAAFTYGRVEEVAAEYRLNRSFLIQALVDEEGLPHVNLKLHWEF